MNVGSYVFHVAGGKMVNKITSRISTKIIHGSCFYLKDSVFITAGHVLKHAIAGQHRAVGFIENGVYCYRDILDYEVIEKYDLGIFKIDVSNLNLPQLKWAIKPKIMLNEVMTVGFPFGLIVKEDKNLIVTRAFLGYIMSRRDDIKRYELSFNCPRGLSGAPLLDRNNKEIVGIILGNSIVKINVCKIQERVGDGGTKIIHEQDETVYFGEALQSQFITRIDSKLLGTTIENFIGI